MTAEIASSAAEAPESSPATPSLSGARPMLSSGRFAALRSGPGSFWKRRFSEPRRRVIQNLTWLLIDRAIALADAFLIGALVARHLGPDKVGVLAYAASIVAVMSTLATLGTDTVVVRQLIRLPEQRGKMIWSLAAARAAAAALLFFIIAAMAAAAFLARSLTGTEAAVLILCSVPLLCSPLLLAKLLLDAALLAKWQVWAANAVLAVSALARCLLIYTDASVVAFAAVSAAAAVGSGILTAAVVWKLKLLPPPRAPDLSVVKEFFKECWPLAISALSIGLYMNMDVVLLRLLKDAEAAGIYSVATRLSSVWYFLPIVIATSCFPALAQVHAADLGAYARHFRRFLDANCVASYLCVILAITIFPTLVRYLYGESFEPSISVFWIHIWAVPFVFIGVARSQHLNLESLHRFNLVSTLLGVVANLSLNLLLIPPYGPHGAACATVLSYCLSAYLSSFFVRELRPVGREQTAAFLVSPWRLLRAWAA